MASPVSIGDVLMLSSLAWKIGRAFTSGRAGAPAESREVEDELRSLKASLKILADILKADDSLLSQADRRTIDGLRTTLSSCHETLKDLESLVDRYQEIRTRDGSESPTAARMWKGRVQRDYKKILWTSESGNIQALRNMLQMHVGSISITVKALQCQSLARLENTVHPMANQVEGLHDTVGEIDVKIAEMHAIMTMSSPGTSPSISPLRKRDTLFSTTDTLVGELSGEASRSSSGYGEILKPEYTLPKSGLSSSPEHGEGLFGHKKRQTSSRNSIRSDPQTSGVSTRASVCYETLPTGITDSLLTLSEACEASCGTSQSLQGANTIAQLDLPQPAISPSDPSLTLRLPSAAVHSDPPEIILEDYHRTSEAASTSQQKNFERTVLENAVMLCQRTGISVDYTRRIETEAGPQEESIKLIQAMKACTISIVTKTRCNSAGRLRHVTSIWAMSEDRRVRMQQQLEDDVEIIPYTVWDKTASVVLRVPTKLKFYDIDPYDEPMLTANTSWVNYHFKSEHESAAFQSALMWKRLLYSFRTQRTVLSHEGFVLSTFSFREQLCGLENIRLWRDVETGSTIAMIQYSPNFYEGYLSFRISGPGTVAKLVDDGDKWVKVRRLNIILEPLTASAPTTPSSPSSISSSRGKKMETKKITAIRVEFSTAEEKYKFLEVCGTRKGR